MSKSVLIIDTPDCCGRCIFAEDDASGMYCIAHDEDYIDIPDTMGGKPDWCPLRDLQMKKELMKIPERPTMRDFERKGYQNGWNACLDAITGEV